jgi:hypothetical protein
MDAENNNDETNDSSSQTASGSEETPASQLRDLRLEKDPMGGGNTTLQGADTQDSAGGTSAN